MSPLIRLLHGEMSYSPSGPSHSDNNRITIDCRGCKSPWVHKIKLEYLRQLTT